MVILCVTAVKKHFSMHNLLFKAHTGSCLTKSDCDTDDVLSYCTESCDTNDYCVPLDVGPSSLVCVSILTCTGAILYVMYSTPGIPFIALIFLCCCTCMGKAKQEEEEPLLAI